MKIKFKNPLKKNQDVAIVSNDEIKDQARLLQAKALLDKSNTKTNETIDDEDEEFNFDEDRDEDLSSDETIDPIKLNKRRLDSLRQIYAELEKQDKEQNLKLKILRKKDLINKKKEKYQELMEIQAEQDKFYEEPKNEEGYYILKMDKWNDEYDDWLLKLAKATNDDERKQIQKELKRLEGIKSKNKTKNRMNKTVRTINKISYKIGSTTRKIGKFSDSLSKELGSIGQMGQQRGRGGKKNSFDDFFSDSKHKDNTDWNNFFSDEKKETVKRKRKTKKSKKKKAKKKKAKKKTTKRKKKTEPKPKKQGFDVENFFR